MELELSLSPPNQKIKRSCHGDDHRVSRYPPVSWNHDEQANSFFTPRKLDDDREGLTRRMELFVKVKMDGVGIARKIDLSGFHSYQTLTTALIHMFDKAIEVEEDGASYKLMYQHRDGHWHLGGDLPWEYIVYPVSKTYTNGEEVAKNG